MESRRTGDALRILREVANDREHNLLRYYANRTEDSDDEADEESPIFDCFYNVRENKSIIKITNF